jgi:hypothetical protein
MTHVFIFIEHDWWRAARFSRQNALPQACRGQLAQGLEEAVATRCQGLISGIAPRQRKNPEEAQQGPRSHEALGGTARSLTAQKNARPIPDHQGAFQELDIDALLTQQFGGAWRLARDEPDALTAIMSMQEADGARAQAAVAVEDDQNVSFLDFREEFSHGELPRVQARL